MRTEELTTAVAIIFLKPRRNGHAGQGCRKLKREREERVFERYFFFLPPNSRKVIGRWREVLITHAEKKERGWAMGG